MSGKVAGFSGAWAAARPQISTMTKKSLPVIIVAHGTKNEDAGATIV
jgi:hypothetical protein